MKSTEPLDDANKSVDLSSAPGATANPESALISDAKRRRLVRGAMALAPLVLTLRSGAVAAAVSCTAAKAIGTLEQIATTDQNNLPITRFKINATEGIPSGQSEVCATDAQQCPANGGEGIKINGGVQNGVVLEQGAPGGGIAYRYCDGGSYNNGQPVAILSAASATSLYG